MLKCAQVHSSNQECTREILVTSHEPQVREDPFNFGSTWLTEWNILATDWSLGGSFLAEKFAQFFLSLGAFQECIEIVLVVLESSC